MAVCGPKVDWLAKVDCEPAVDEVAAAVCKAFDVGVDWAAAVDWVAGVDSATPAVDCVAGDD